MNEPLPIIQNITNLADDELDQAQEEIKAEQERRRFIGTAESVPLPIDAAARMLAQNTLIAWDGKDSIRVQIVSGRQTIHEFQAWLDDIQHLFDIGELP